MIRILPVCVAVLLSAVASAADSDWTKYTSKEGRFTALFPASPKEKEMKANGETITRNVVVGARRDGTHYDIGCISYAKSIADKLNTLDSADFAKRQKAATIKRTEGKILSQKDITVGKEKRPGYELLIQTGPKQFIRQRALYVAGRLYQLMVAGTSRDAVTGATADKFVDSFRLAD